MDCHSSQQTNHFSHYCINGHSAQVLCHLSHHPRDLRKSLVTMAEHGQVACLHEILQHHTISESVQKDLFCEGVRAFQPTAVEYVLNNFEIDQKMVINSFSWLSSSIGRMDDYTTNSICRLLLERIELQYYPPLFKKVARSGHEFSLAFMLDSDAPKTILPNINDQIDMWPIVFWGCQHFSNSVYPSLITHDEHTRAKYQRLWEVCVVHISAQDLEQRLTYESQFRDNARTLFEKAYILVEQIKRDELLQIAQNVHTGLTGDRKKI